MLKALKQDIFIFSALKTHAQLQEASKELLDEAGNVRSFQQFEQAYKQINSNYNVNYLEAEYEFAVSTSQSAANWSQTNTRYNLQYRTAGDERVRISHQVLNKITLPVEDDFWKWYYPPNGWRCRCNAVQVIKDKYEVSDSEASIALGDTATTQIGANGKNKLEIFRFNPGVSKVVFPPEHPYRKLQDSNTVIKQVS